VLTSVTPQLALARVTIRSQAVLGEIVILLILCINYVLHLKEM